MKKFRRRLYFTASHNHILLFENDRVRVLDTYITAGGRTPLHTRCRLCSKYVLSWCSSRCDGDQDGVMLDSRQTPTLANPPQALWLGPLVPHSLEIVGDTDLSVISVELKT